MLYSSIFNSRQDKFEDRYDAGTKLADKLMKYKDEDVVILALPRGGVPVAYQVARELSAPLSVIVSRKIGAPGHEEYGLGAISEENSLYLDNNSMIPLDIDRSDLTETIDKEKAELRRRVEVYRDNKPLPGLKNKTVILVDDGLATGGTAKAAIEAVKKKNADKIVLAIPVCAKQSMQEIENKVDGMVCLLSPVNMRAIGLYYENFDQTTDEEVVRLLTRSSQTQVN